MFGQNKQFDDNTLGFRKLWLDLTITLYLIGRIITWKNVGRSVDNENNLHGCFICDTNFRYLLEIAGGNSWGISRYIMVSNQSIYPKKILFFKESPDIFLYSKRTPRLRLLFLLLLLSNQHLPLDNSPFQVYTSPVYQTTQPPLICSGGRSWRSRRRTGDGEKDNERGS